MTSSPADVGNTVALLERLSIAMINAVNERDFDFTSPEAQEVVKHLSSYWCGEIDTQPSKVTWEEQKSAWKARTEEHPDVIFSIREISVDVNEQKGVATVILEMEVSGYGDVKLMAINESRWRRVSGDWQCHYTLGMRGSPMNSGLP